MPLAERSTAARAGPVSERLVYRRLADPEFRRELSDARAEMVDRATGRLADAMSGAVESLVTLAGEANSEAARVSAAWAVVEFGMRLREVEEFERRLADVEAMAPRRTPAGDAQRPDIVGRSCGTS
jgi:hypothetical protein